MPAIETSNVVTRTLAGPFGVRKYVTGSNGNAWFLKLRSPVSPGIVEKLGQTEALLADWRGPGHICMPQAVDEQTFVYSDVRSPALLFDALFIDGTPAKVFEVLFGQLGEFLASLHGHLAATLPFAGIGAVPAWDPAASSHASEVAQSLANISFEAAPRLRFWADEDLEPAKEFGSLVHGRFSSASIAWDAAMPGEFNVLGWLDVGRGNPLFDLAQMASEITEAVAAGSLSVDDGRRIIRSFFLGAGWEGNRPRVRALTARALVNHMGLRAWTTGDSKDLPLFLARIERALDLLTLEVAL